MPPSDPGVSAPPAEPAAPAAPIEPTQPSGGEPVTSTGASGSEHTVPFGRFQEVNDKAKDFESKYQQAQEELESLRESQSQKTNTDEDIDPDVLDLVKRSAGKLGFVSKEELDAREARLQVQQDITDLASQYKDSGIPFDGKKIIEYAKANGMQITSKKSLDAVYKEMNYEAIIEANRKAAIDSYQKGNLSGGEKPGSKGAQAPQEQKPGSLKDRIAAARQKAGFSLS
jgi:hypothetical protein